MIKDYFWDTDSTIRKQLSTLITQYKIVPIIGSGFTRGMKARNGVVPSGEDMA